MYNPKGTFSTFYLSFSCQLNVNTAGKYKIPVAGPTRITNEDFLINVICAQGVPKADIGSESDPYIFFWLEDSERNPRGCLGKSPSKDDAKNPWWYCIRNMGAVPRDGDALIVEMYDRDALGSDFLGFCVISASELDYTPKVCSMSQSHSQSQVFPMITPGYKKANCTVTLCIHQWTPPTEVCTLLNRSSLSHQRDVKHVFFIRHGESVWNEAQKDVNVGKMMNYDHPLNKEGIRQAQTLNAAWKNSLAENNRKIASAKKSPTLERTGITLSMSRTRRTSAPNESSTGFDTPAASSPSNRARTMSGIPANNFQQTNPFANPGSPPPITSRSPSVSPVLDTPFDEKVDLFVNSDLIFASPLTRAVETCVIALDGHPHLKENKVKLLSTCREIKVKIQTTTVLLSKGPWRFRYSR